MLVCNPCRPSPHTVRDVYSPPAHGLRPRGLTTAGHTAIARSVSLRSWVPTVDGACGTSIPRVKEAEGLLAMTQTSGPIEPTLVSDTQPSPGPLLVKSTPQPPPLLLFLSTPN